LAGKIAYIYYRFDVSDEKFIGSVKDNGEYVKDRRNFATQIATLYAQYKQDFEECYINNDTSINKQTLITSFINSIGDELKIQQHKRPQVSFNANGNAGTYDKATNTISVDITNGDLYDILDTIVHEYRHFYIDYVINYNISHNLNKNIIIRFIYHSLYIDTKYYTIFDKFDKICASFDEKASQCYNGQLYIMRKKKASPLYFIQPKERDCRVVAGLFMSKI
ncbi:hypothetical protein CQA53_11040, partial [Helicobacter didelphidarum]